MMDKEGITYLGHFSQEELRPLEWTHLAISIGVNTYSVYINGKTVEEGLDLYPGEPTTQRHTCPYARTPPALVPNNTIMQIGAPRHKASMRGMLQDLVVVRNKAMTGAEVQALLMAASPPRTPPLLMEMLTSIGIYSLEGVCEPMWEHNAYLQASWGNAHPGYNPRYNASYNPSPNPNANPNLNLNLNPNPSLNPNPPQDCVPLVCADPFVSTPTSCCSGTTHISPHAPRGWYMVRTATYRIRSAWPSARRRRPSQWA